MENKFKKGKLTDSSKRSSSAPKRPATARTIISKYKKRTYHKTSPSQSNYQILDSLPSKHPHKTKKPKHFKSKKGLNKTQQKKDSKKSPSSSKRQIFQVSQKVKHPLGSSEKKGKTKEIIAQLKEYMKKQRRKIKKIKQQEMIQQKAKIATKICQLKKLSDSYYKPKKQIKQKNPEKIKRLQFTQIELVYDTFYEESTPVEILQDEQKTPIQIYQNSKQEYLQNQLLNIAACKIQSIIRGFLTRRRASKISIKKALKTNQFYKIVLKKQLDWQEQQIKNLQNLKKKQLDDIQKLTGGAQIGTAILGVISQKYQKLANILQRSYSPNQKPQQPPYISKGIKQNFILNPHQQQAIQTPNQTPIISALSSPQIEQPPLSILNSPQNIPSSIQVSSIIPDPQQEELNFKVKQIPFFDLYRQSAETSEGSTQIQQIIRRSEAPQNICEEGITSSSTDPEALTPSGVEWVFSIDTHLNQEQEEAADEELRKIIEQSLQKPLSIQKDPIWYLEQIFNAVLPKTEEIQRNLNSPLIKAPVDYLQKIQQSEIGLFIQPDFPNYPPIIQLQIKSNSQQPIEKSTVIYKKLILDIINQCLQKHRKYGLKGVPMPWSSQYRTISHLTPNLNQLAIQIAQQIQQWNTICAGKLPVRLQNQGLNQQILHYQREENLANILAEEILTQDEIWVDYEFQQVQLKLDLADIVLDELLSETLSILPIT